MVETLYLASRAVIIGCLAIIVFLVVVDVTGRSLFGSGLPGTVEINEYLLIIIGFLGIFQTDHEKGHVSVDLLFNKLSPATQTVLSRLNHSMIFLFSLLFMGAGAERFWSAFQCGETNWFGSYVMPVWFVRLVVPLGCFALCLQSLINLRYPEVVAEKTKAKKKSTKRS